MFPLADAIVVELGPQSLYVVGGREPGGLSDDRTTNTIASIDPVTTHFTTQFYCYKHDFISGYI